MGEIIIYSDLNSYSPSKKFLLKNVESVYSSLENIFSTNKEERLFRPEFGESLDEFLFELMDDITAMRLEDFIIEAVGKWEPRVTLDHKLSSVTAIPEENRYDVLLVFEIQGIDNESFRFAGEVSR